MKKRKKSQRKQGLLRRIAVHAKPDIFYKVFRHIIIRQSAHSFAAYLLTAMMRRWRNRPLHKLTRSHEYITLFSIQIWNGREYEGQVQKICSEDETISTEERSDHPSNASLFQPFMNNTFKVSAIQLVSCNRQSKWREPQVDKWQWIFFLKILNVQCVPVND